MEVSSGLTFNSLKAKIWKKKRSLNLTDYDPIHKVIYLGNVLTPWAKGEGCVDKPLATLWKNYCSNVKHEIYMKVTICASGLKAITREHGLTEYWANRITFCYAHPSYPKVFCWVYRHEGRRLKQELRCHAVLCSKESKAKEMATELTSRLVNALQEFRREKRMRQNTRLLLSQCQDHNRSLNNTSLSTSTNLISNGGAPLIPLRKKHLVKGQVNFRPPLERSKSAPRLTSIDELQEEDDMDHNNRCYPDEDDVDPEDLPESVEDCEVFLNNHGVMDVRMSTGCCGSITSDGQDTTSDTAFSDEIDSLSDQLTSLSTNTSCSQASTSGCGTSTTTDPLIISSASIYNHNHHPNNNNNNNRMRSVPIIHSASSSISTSGSRDSSPETQMISAL